MSEGLSDQLELGIACRRVGECYCEVGEYEQAVLYQKRHLQIARRIGKCCCLVCHTHALLRKSV